MQVGAVDNGFTWKIVLYPRGKHTELKDYLSVYLHLVSSKKPNESADVKFKFSLLNARREAEAFQTENKFLYKKLSANGSGHGLAKLVERNFLFDEANGLFPNDKLIILCEIAFCLEKIRTEESNCTRTLNIRVPECKLSYDFGAMFDCQKFGDAIVGVNGKEFSVYI